jgi:predicted PurR-regulated permease PerM
MSIGNDTFGAGFTRHKMTPDGSNNSGTLEDRLFLALILVVSLAFAWIVIPIYGAILWGIVIAIIFSPLHNRILVYARRPNLAALATLGLVVAIVIVPLTVFIIALANEAAGVHEKIQSGDLNFGRYFQQVLDAMPGWAGNLLERFGLSNLSALKEKLASGLSHATRVMATQAINIGQNTLHFFLNLFVMLYLLFFFLRDGRRLYRQVRAAVPLRTQHKRALFDKVTVVIRATVKGNIVVAILQGALGGLIFWILGIQAPLLWGALMCLLSLVPAVGAAMIWLPVSIYLLATSAVWKGVILLVYGVLVISLVDNLVRPILVGKDTRMPDYIILVSTLGGIAVFGVNGFIVGPLVAAMFISVWGIFAENRSQFETS